MLPCSKIRSGDLDKACAPVNGIMATIEDSSSRAENGSRGARIGQGGGANGNPEGPGDFGERQRDDDGDSAQVKYLGGPISLTALITVVLASIGGIVWLVQMRGDIDAIRGNQFGRDAGISLRGEVAEVRGRQVDIISRLEKFDAGGTNALVSMRERLANLQSEISGQDNRCKDLNRSVDEIRRKIIEHDIQMQLLLSGSAKKVKPSLSLD